MIDANANEKEDFPYLSACWQSISSRQEWEQHIQKLYFQELFSEKGKESCISPLREKILQVAQQRNGLTSFQTFLIYIVKEKENKNKYEQESITDTKMFFSEKSPLWMTRDISFSILQIKAAFEDYKYGSNSNSILSTLLANYDLNLYSSDVLGKLPFLIKFRRELSDGSYSRSSVEEALRFIQKPNESEIQEKYERMGLLFNLEMLEKVAKIYNVWPFGKKELLIFQGPIILANLLDRMIDYLIRDHNLLIHAAASKVKDSNEAIAKEIVIDNKNDQISRGELAIIDIVHDVTPLCFAFATYSFDSSTGRPFLNFDFEALENLITTKFGLIFKKTIINKLSNQVSSCILDIESIDKRLLNLPTSEVDLLPITAKLDFHQLINSTCNSLKFVNECLLGLETLCRYASRQHNLLMRSATEDYCVAEIKRKIDDDFMKQRKKIMLYSYFESFQKLIDRSPSENQGGFLRNFIQVEELFSCLKERKKSIFVEEMIDFMTLLKFKRLLLLSKEGARIFPEKYHLKHCEKKMRCLFSSEAQTGRYFCLAKYLYELLEYWEKEEYKYYSLQTKVHENSSMENPNLDWPLKFYLNHYHAKSSISEYIIDELVSEDITVSESSSFLLKVISFGLPSL